MKKKKRKKERRDGGRLEFDGGWKMACNIGAMEVNKEFWWLRRSDEEEGRKKKGNG